MYEVVDNRISFTIFTEGGYEEQLAGVRLILAEYDEDMDLTSVKFGNNSEIKQNGSMTSTADLPQTDNYKYMLWDETGRPLMKAVTDILR